MIFQALIDEKLDILLAVAGIASSIGVLVWGVMYDSSVALLIGLLLLISCIAWLRLRKDASLDVSPSKGLEQYYPVSIYFILYAASIFILDSRSDIYQRPISFFVVLSIMAGIIATEIILSRPLRRHIVLIQIIILGLLIGWSQEMIYPSLAGIDPWYHEMFTTSIIDSSVIPQDLSYTNFPIYHLYVASTGLMTGLSYKFAAMFSVSAAQIICNTLLVFLLGTFLFKNERVGTMAALLLVVAPSHIYMSFWSIPNAFAVIFILLVLFCLYRYIRTGESTMLMFSIIGMGTLILTHTITALCLAIILFVSSASFAFYNICYAKSRGVSPLRFPIAIPIAYSAALLAWWTYDHGTIMKLGELIRFGFRKDVFAPDMLASNIEIAPLEAVSNVAGMYLFIILAFIGLFFILSEKRDQFSFNMVFIGVMPFMLNFIAVLGNLSIIEHRWWYFAEVLLSIPLAISLLLLGKWRETIKLPASLLPAAVVLVLTFFVVMSPEANIDNHAFSPNRTSRLALTEGDLQSIDTLSHQWDGKIMTDMYFANSQYWRGRNIGSFCNVLVTRNYSSLENSLVLVDDMIIGKPFCVFRSEARFDFDMNEDLTNSGFSNNYDCGQVNGYVMSLGNERR